MEKTFGSMVEELKSPDNQYINVTPPLHLKELGQCVSRLVLLSEGNHNLDGSFLTAHLCFKWCYFFKG